MEMTHNIIGAAMQVHKVWGNGFQEVIYQRALEIELPLYGLSFKREVEMPAGYRNRSLLPRHLCRGSASTPIPPLYLTSLHQRFMPVRYRNRQIGTRRVDFLVEEVLSVERKALIQLEDVHPTQAMIYLEAYNIEVGLLINFGSKSLQVKRLINPKYKTV